MRSLSITVYFPRRAIQTNRGDLIHSIDLNNLIQFTETIHYLIHSVALSVGGHK